MDIDLQCETKTNRKGIVVSKLWYYMKGSKKIRHRDGEPAYLRFNIQGNVVFESWYKHGKKNRDGDLPSMIEYKHNSSLYEYSLQRWCKDGKCHRENGPALIINHRNHVEENWFYNGKRHRDGDLPARVCYPRDDSYKHIVYFVRQWYNHGKLHRIGGPACMNQRSDSRSEMWYIHGVCHREDGPAARNWDKDNKITYELWSHNGVYHREDGPTLTCLNTLDMIEINWFKNGQRHRDGGPALTYIHSDGTKTEHWYNHDKLHRNDGPSTIKYERENDEIIEIYNFHINGVSIDEEVQEWMKTYGYNMEGNFYLSWTDEDKFLFKLIFAGR